MISSLKDLKNSQKLTIISFASSFGQYPFSTKVGYWIPLAKIRFDHI